MRLLRLSILLLGLLVATKALASDTHTVVSGDRLGNIASQYGVTVDQLREWNDLDGDTIRIGQDLIVREPRRAPAEITVEVRSGDILGSIAQRHGVTVAQIREWNNLRNDTIHPGQRLIIRPGEAAAQRELRDSGMVEVEVRPGDILGSIAERHRVTVAQIRQWNNLQSDIIYPGQRLRVRPGARDEAAAARPAGGGASSGTSSMYQTHTVARGETLIGIAQRHGVTVDQIRQWNPRVTPERLQIGQTLRIGSPTGRMVRRISYEVQPGDFLERIARRHNVTVDQIVSWNRGLNPHRLQIGQLIIIMVEGPEETSVSAGRAFDGRLINGEQLPPHRAFRIRDPNRSWGTNFTISALLDAFEHMARRFPDKPQVMVYNISRENGGPLGNHRSHQSGRDVDITYYRTNCGRLCDWRRVRPQELHVEYQWELIHFWIRNDLVDYMFVDYSLQPPLYEHARSRGATAAQLNQWFQYPHGRNAARGIVRHSRGHADHIHVRFSCAPGDDRCR
ncbi:MAG: LysM peptidoglycan-binding domain-containing protein [Deltaproteobacteria bacterium]|nr:MAG: LysM peptidoglycan-binding domain-containing protein [Deltaproteobacteria bacterium]